MPTTILVNHKNTKPNYDNFFTDTSLGFRTNNSSKLKQIIKFISTVIDNVNFGFYPEGIKIKSMSLSHITLIDILIPKELFSTYNCGSGFVRGINVKYFSQILNHLKNEDELVISFEANCDKMDIYFINSKYNKLYSLSLMDIDSEDLDISGLEELTELSIDSKYFNEIIHDFNDIGEQIRFKILKDKEKISLKSDGSFTSLKMVLQNDEDITYRNLQNIELFFDIEIMTLFTKCYNLNNKIIIKIGHNIPIEFKYMLFETGYIRYFIAPKIGEDSD
jgi:proliferating cell nuclear antigen